MWNFPEAPERTLLTTPDILDGTVAALYVTRSLTGRSWQFLEDEEDEEAEHLVQVTFAELFDAVPALQALRDLAPGWSAYREAPGEEWEHEPDFPTDWDELLSLSLEHFDRSLERARAAFRVGEYDRFEYDLQTGRFCFLKDDAVIVTADLQIVGSLSLASSTWRWAWANEHLPPESHWLFQGLGDFGAACGLERLAETDWTAEEADGWELAAICAWLTDGEMVYRAPLDPNPGVAWLVLYNFRWAGGEE